MNKVKSIKELKIKVERILRDFPSARNSDVYLTQMIIYSYCHSQVKKDKHGRYWFSADSFYMVREDNVKRIRAYIQNVQGRFLPDDLKVRKQRNIDEEAWRKFLGYNPELKEVRV